MINVLVVDDDSRIGDLLKLHLLAQGVTSCSVVTSCTIALELLAENHFDICIADFQMPDLSGVEFFQRVDRISPDIIKVLFSGFANLNIIGDKTDIGSFHYFISKPWQQTQLTILLNSATQIIKWQREVLSLRKELQVTSDDLAGFRQQVEGDFDATEKMLTAVGSLGMAEIHRHCRRTQLLAVKLGHVCGLNEDELKVLAQAAAYHDLGMLALPDKLRTVPYNYLSNAYKLQYNKHPSQAATILSRHEKLRDAAVIIEEHHENVDGSGFHGKKGGEISISGRILRIVDYYDEALNFNERAHQDLIPYMEKFKGRWFDAEIFEKFILMAAKLGK